MKTFKKQLSNDSGFTLMEIIIAFLIIAVLAAASIGAYSLIVGNANVTSTINNVGKLRTLAVEYAGDNSGSYNTITPYNMQQDGVLPTGWNVSSGSYVGIPPNNSFVSEYAIGPATGPDQGTLIIGMQFTDEATYSNIENICNGFINSLTGYTFSPSATLGTPPTSDGVTITTSTNSCSSIMSGETPSIKAPGSVLWLDFN